MMQVGDQFDQYQIQVHIAQGGMSDIYRAYDMVNRREVVLKVPDQTMIGDPAQYERFRRELEVMQILSADRPEGHQHPAILRGLDSGMYNRIPYLVTELVEGRSLRQVIEADAPLSPDQAVSLVRKIASGMAFCHDHGIIHRDLKPENILVTSDGQPVIIDFGLALTKGAHRITYANLSAAAGTPDYMAPEQVEGQRGDMRTDVYALGTILYELLAGKTPLRGDTQLAVMSQHLHGVPPRLDRAQPGVSPHLAAVVARCLQRDPDDRYPDMHALDEALAHPETADLSILERLPSRPVQPVVAWQVYLKAILIGWLIILALVALAVLAQVLR